MSGAEGRTGFAIGHYGSQQSFLKRHGALGVQKHEKELAKKMLGR